VKVAAVVQARMSSTRFPGKMLHWVSGRPLIEYVLDRVRSSREIDQVIVATSVDTTDLPIAEYCRDRGVECFRGSLNDVASRFRDVSDVYEIEAFVRVCGDSPLLDPAVIDRGVRAFRELEPDLMTNCFPRTFPRGQSVEVVRVSTLRSAYTRMTKAAHFEHVTAFLYEHAGEYRIHNFTNPAGNQSDLDFSVNTPDEMALFERLVECGEDAPDLSRIVALYRTVAV
jgi:spore coat polysaccharide biosynthesis protein SpsF